MRRSLATVALAAACALFAAGCAGDGGSAGSGASIAPASTKLFIAINTDLESDQIQKARALLERFPGGPPLLRLAQAELSNEDVDFETDVKPALGPELDVVVLDLPQGGEEPAVVLLLQPDDSAKLDALLAKSDEKPVRQEIDGWTVLAEDQAMLARFEGARGDESLEDTDAFSEAMEDLPEDSLVRLYLDGEGVTEALSASPDFDAQQLRQVLPGGEIPSVGASLAAEDEGVRLDASAETEQEVESFQAELPSELPAGALAYAGFQNLAKGIRESLNRAGETNSRIDQRLAQIELLLGLSLDEDVLPLFENEGAIAVYPGAADESVPVVEVVLKVEDEQGAVATIDQILARGSQFLPMIPQPTPTDIDGVQAKAVTFGAYSLVYAAFDGKLVLGLGEESIAALRTDGEKLADDPVFRQAIENAGMPDDTAGFLYVNLAEGARYLSDLAQASGESVPPQVGENLEPLQSLLFYATADGERVKASGFLGIE